MAQHDYDIANQSFPSFRSDLNSVLEAINTSNSGISRPSSAVAGTIWLDTTSASSPTLKFYDGADDISLATLDYTANTVNWLDSTVTVDVVGDTTPQLGGNLDVNGNSIVSVANGNITITPDGTGKLIVSGLSYPTADGTNGQALITDGSGNLSFGDVAGGTNWQSSIVTGTTLSAVAGNGYWIDTTSNACTVTLPASASVGDTIEFVDYARTWGTNRITLALNGLKYQGGTVDALYDTNGQSVRIVYSGATKGWIPTSDDDVTDESTVSYDAEYLVIAGGGAGGNGNGGGGGAGGLLTNFGGTPISLEQGTVYTATIGSGASTTSANSHGGDGSDSSLSGSNISTITAIGGGGGGYSGSSPNSQGNSGGSGGGNGYGGTSTRASGTVGQGNDGGLGAGDAAPQYGGGGGGGSANVGGDGTANTGGNGGNGSPNSITGTATDYAGGGGGSGNTNGNGSGGNGGGGVGGRDSTPGGNGTVNTGGGGGGTNYTTSPSGVGGAGGSGVIFLRVPTASYSGTTTGSPTVTTDGTDTIIKFTASGSYTA